MRLLLTIFMLSFSIYFSNAQKMKYTQSLNGIDWVKIESKKSVVVKSHDKNELLIQVTPFVNDLSKIKGLKRIYNNGVDNTDVGCNVRIEGNNLIVEVLRNNLQIEVFLPKKMNVSVNIIDNGDINLEGFTSEIEATSINGKLTLINVSGPVTASSYSGAIEILFKEVHQSLPSSVSSFNADIDISLPKNTPSNIKMTSIKGDIFTNFDIHQERKSQINDKITNQKVIGLINKGGVSITLKTTLGNIFLRKNN